MTFPTLSEVLSPLALAVIDGDVGRARALLDAGASVDERDRAHRESYQLSILHGRPPEPVRVALFREEESYGHGVSLGISSLMLAALYGHVECLELLLERGADPNATDRLGHAALELAVINDRRACVERLVRAGASLRPRRHDLLAKAVELGHADVAGLLLDLGLEATARIHGESYTMLALRRGQAALAAALGDRLGPVTCMGCDASTIELGPFGMVLSGTREEGYRYDTIWRCSACGETYPYRTKGEDRLWRTWHEP